MRMHYVTGYLGTNFIRILSVKKKVPKKKKNQRSLRKEKNWVVELGSTKRWASSICCYCCCSVTQSHPALCDPMNCSTTGFPILHHLPELPQTHVHWVGDAIQPTCALSSASPLAFNLSQHQVLVRLLACGQSIGASASVLPVNIQDWFPLGLTSLISFLSKGLSKVSNTTIQKHQFFNAQLSLWSNSHIHT